MPATPSESHTFLAYRAGLRIVFKPRRDQIDESGQRLTGAIAGKAVQFTDGVLRVPKDGDMLIAEGNTVPAKEIFELLEKHPLNGDRNGGFWLNPEIVPEPTSNDQTELMSLAQNFDVEGLKEFIATEGDGFNREKLLEPAREALDKAEAAHERAAALANEKGKYDDTLVADLKAEADKRGLVYAKETKAVLIAALEADDAGDAPQEVPLTALKQPQLKALLDEKKIEYPNGVVSNADLIKLLEDAKD